MRKYALLIGNGLNRAIDNQAWEEILKNIADKYNVKRNKSHKNMPLEFERISLASMDSGYIKSEIEIKKDIIELLPQIEDLSLHKQYTNLPISDIMTCNYDYHLEKALDSQFDEKEAEMKNAERTNSLFRKKYVKNKRVWHIHGELNKPSSICLGYNHYCAYLSRIREYLTYTMPSVSKSRLKQFAMGELSQEEKEASWPMLFFSHDIFVVGFDMSFLETDIWWLLTYRKHFWLKHRDNKCNKIYYFYNGDGEKIDEEKRCLLESVGVEIKEVIPEKNEESEKKWKDFYAKVHLEIQKIVAG